MPVEQIPVYGKLRERRAGIAETQPASSPLPHHELPRLQLLEERAHAQRTAEARREAGRVYRRAALNARAHRSPERAQQVALGLLPLPQLALDTIGRSEEPHPEP